MSNRSHKSFLVLLEFVIIDNNFVFILGFNLKVWNLGLKQEIVYQIKLIYYIPSAHIVLNYILNLTVILESPAKIFIHLFGACVSNRRAISIQIK